MRVLSELIDQPRLNETHDTSQLLGLALRAAGIPRCFGIPGVQNLRLYEMLGRGVVDPVLIANEASAAYLAVGQYQSTGQIGCVNVIGGPGITHALPGIEFAFRTHTPVLVLTTGCARDDGRAYQLHDVDNLGVLAPLCKATHRLTEEDDVHEVVARLIEAAHGGVPGPCALEVPMHLLRRVSTFREREPRLRPAEVPSAWRNSALPPALASALESCAVALGRDGLYVVSDREHQRIPSRRGAVPLALGAAFSRKLAVAVTDAESLVAFAPELTLATARRLPLIILVEQDAAQAASLDLVANLTGVRLIRSTGEAEWVRELVEAMRTPEVVICEIERAGDAVAAPEPVALETSWLAAFQQGVRGSGLGSVFIAGDGRLSAVADALSSDGVSVRSVRHDQNLGFVADGASRSSARPAAIILPEEWALSSVLSGVGEAHLDQVPLVVLIVAATTPGPWLGTLKHLSKSATVVASVEDMAGAILEAAQLSRAGAPGPVCLVCPANLATSSSGTQPTRAPTAPSLAQGAPTDAELDAVAQMFLRSKQPVIFVGRGAREGSAELVELAHRTGAVVASTLSGKGVFPETDPLWLWGGFGPLSPPPMKALAEACDGALILGARLSELGGAHYRARFPAYCFHVDIDPAVPNKAASAIGITADARVFLQALLKHLDRHYRESLPRRVEGLLEQLQAARAWVDADVRERREEGRGIDPYELVRTVQAGLPPETVFCADSGNGTIHALEALRLTAPDRFLCPADYNSMGYSVPAALGAAGAHPSVPVVSFVGDGAFLMTGLKSLLGEPEAPPIITVVLRDRRLGMIGDIQRATNRPEVCTQLSDFDLGAFKYRRPGLRFESVSTSEALARSVQAARVAWEAGQGTLIECLINPETKSYFFQGALSSAAVPVPRRVPRLPTVEGPPGDLWEVIERAKDRFAERVALRDGARQYRYGEVHARVSRLAQFLREQGVGPGDVVGVMLRNRSEVVEAHFAAAGLRAVVLNINVRLAAPELKDIFKQAGVKWLIASTDFAPTLSETLAIGDLRLGGVLWVAPGQEPRVLPELTDRLGTTRDYEGALTASTAPFVPATGSEFDAFHLYYTSGTTGFPKAVRLTHRQVFHHAIATAEEMHITGEDVWGHFSPMYHVVDAFAIYALTWLGGQHVMVSDPDPTHFLSLLASERITCTNLAAAAAHFLIHSPDLGTHDFSRLRILSCGGSALDAGSVERLIQIFGCEIFMSYGMTECCGKISMSLLSDEHRQLSQGEQFERIATSGRPFKLMDVRIVDEQGADVARDNQTMGEVWIRGLTVFSGYFNDDTATREAFQDGWFKTGDLATIRPDGYLTIAGRKKDMIISYGENVYPGEVERALGSHPGVQQVAVYGIENPTAGEVVKAVIRLRAGHSLTAREVIAFCRGQLAGYKVPSEVEFIDEMPMTGTFKVDKLRLKRREARTGEATATGAKAPVVRVRPRTGVVERVLKIVEGIRVSDEGPVATTATLWSLGLDSILFLTLLRELEKEFQLKLDPNFLVQNNTIEMIARAITQAPVESQAAAPAPHEAPPLLNEALLSSWSATVERRLGGFESLVYQANRRGLLHINPVVDMEGPVDHSVMREAAALLEKRHPYLLASIVEKKKGDFFLEYKPGRHLELVFVEESGTESLEQLVARHLRDSGQKKILFIRAKGSPEAHQVIPIFWHCYLEVHAFLRLVRELFELHEQLIAGTPVDVKPQPLPVAREELFSRLPGMGLGPTVQHPDPGIAKTGQEVLSGLELFRANKFKAPFGVQKKRDSEISVAGASRSVVMGREATRNMLGAVVRQQSSLTGALSAALCLVARELFCPAPRPHRMILVGSFDARPLLNLPTETLGYYATYPKFLVDVGPATGFWDLSRHFHRENQAYIDQRTYAGMDAEHFSKLAGGFGAVAKLLWVPGMWEQFTAPGRAFIVNLGVLDSGLGRFKLRGVKVLQDIPALAVYSYVLDGCLHLQTCSQLAPEAADRFAGHIEAHFSGMTAPVATQG
ncbi:AMP-binding protein [Corallococcus sp. bb12-1]|uniref:AMP-binding protein n=1 Tax=Corallococcus sp. bb12-1 TaxID=2996784 RepID=UPI00226D64FC|nr:AMP-binding protein [Corallococcus sp. bb12-1]MCY1042217.1 AMP-binding protein [Corallococcus sp. bb12-1]